ncbi:MAG: hypothetical protein JWR16_1080 [Nevskia sp.]|nr:hypothetical protein [Nevskia sp.]
MIVYVFANKAYRREIDLLREQRVHLDRAKAVQVREKQEAVFRVWTETGEVLEPNPKMAYMIFLGSLGWGGARIDEVPIV